MESMIRWNFIGLMCGLFILVTVPVSSAAIVETSDPNIVYDTSLGKYWFTNLPIFASLDYSEQQDLFNIFNSEDIHKMDNHSWRFAMRGEIQSLYNTFPFPDLFMSHFMNTDLYPWIWGGYVNFYFSGYYNDQDQNPATVGYAEFTYRSYFDPDPQHQNNLSIDFDSKNGAASDVIGAWVIAEHHEVPLPATSWFLGFAALGLFGINRRKK